MRIAVITPYYETPPEWLQECHESVLSQTVSCHHILICDGATQYRGKIKGDHIVLPRNYADYGNTPRVIGAGLALSKGADVITYLDADNWYHNNHVERLLNFSLEENVDIVSSSRVLHRLDGSYIGPCPHVDGTGLVDTNCLLLRGRGLIASNFWTLCPQKKAAIGDQFLWQMVLKRGFTHALSKDRTVAYRTRHAIHYRLANEQAPEEAIERSDLSGKNYH